jgi:hypothetical protein
MKIITHYAPDPESDEFGPGVCVYYADGGYDYCGSSETQEAAAILAAQLNLELNQGRGCS